MTAQKPLLVADLEFMKITKSHLSARKPWTRDSKGAHTGPSRNHRNRAKRYQLDSSDELLQLSHGQTMQRRIFEFRKRQRRRGSEGEQVLAVPSTAFFIPCYRGEAFCSCSKSGSAGVCKITILSKPNVGPSKRSFWGRGTLQNGALPKKYG